MVEPTHVRQGDVQDSQILLRPMNMSGQLEMQLVELYKK